MNSSCGQSKLICSIHRFDSIFKLTRKYSPRYFDAAKIIISKKKKKSLKKKDFIGLSKKYFFSLSFFVFSYHFHLLFKRIYIDSLFPRIVHESSIFRSPPFRFRFHPIQISFLSLFILKFKIQNRYIAVRRKSSLFRP